MTFTKVLAQAFQRGVDFFAFARKGEVSVRFVEERLRVEGRVWSVEGTRLEPPHVSCYKGRIFEEIVTGYVLRELICEKAFVGSVFEKSADEISHAGKEFADGAIFAQATAHFQNGGLDGISHA